MNCPVCNVPLTESVREDISVAECSNCKGLWLNREALTKIIRHNDSDFRAAGQVRQPGSPTMKHARRDEDWLDYYPEGEAAMPKSFLGELFGDSSK